MMLVFLGLKLEVMGDHLVDLKPPGRFFSFTPSAPLAGVAPLAQLL